MISCDYAVTMARYNSWQNNQLHEILQAFDPPELTRDRGAFFGSILKTLSHLVWGDSIWMSRFDGGAGPLGGIADSTVLCADLGSWWHLREPLDRRMRHWAESLDDVSLAADLTWYSGAVEGEVTKPLALLVAHVFNHQTHHRGQIHAMVTACGSKAPVSDLFLMPETI